MRQLPLDTKQHNMLHIRQKNSIETEGYAYIVVIDKDGLYEQHPAMIEHPTLFEVVDENIPEDAQYLNYTG